MSRWAEPIREFHQLLTPDGLTYDLHTASRNGRWVMSSQGWGMPGIDYILQKSPFQHGATVKDYRLQPRIIQLLLQQNFCDREAMFTGREALLNALRPNRTPIAFTDFWQPRSGYQSGGVYPVGADQQSITSLAELNDTLYGGTGDDGSGTGGVLLAWDNAGSWHTADIQPFVTAGWVTYGTAINCLLATVLTLPKYTSQIAMGSEVVGPLYDTGDDGDGSVADLNTWLGQTFTPASDFMLTRLSLLFHKTADPRFGVYAAIYATDVLGHPTGDPLTYAANYSYYMTDVAAGSWVDFPIGVQTTYLQDTYESGARIVLQAGVKYALVVRISRIWLGAAVNWHRDESAPSYAGGAAEASADGGVTWSTDAAKDYMFRIFGYQSQLTYVGTEDRNVLLAGCSTDGIVVPWDGEWLDEFGAPQPGAENDILSLVAFDGHVYAGTSPSGTLMRYDNDPLTGAGTLVEVAPQLGTVEAIHCLCVYDDGGGEVLYGGTDEGSLYQWDGVDEWTEVAASTGESDIWGLCVYQGQLYGVSGPNGYLLQFTGAAWATVSQAVGDDLRTLQVYKGRLYCMGEDGHLYRWNNDTLLESICPEFIGDGGSTEQIWSSILFRNRLFGGTYDGAYLVEYVRQPFSYQPEAPVLRRLLPGGQRRDLRVFIAEGPQFDAQESGWAETQFKELLRFIAYDPVLYDPQEVTVPMLLGLGFVTHAETVTYEGTWETHPKFVLYGPMASPRIINETLDTMIGLDYTIPTNDIVTLDTNMLTCVDNHGTNLLGALSPDSQLSTFRLEPNPAVGGGVNQIVLIGSEMDGDSDCDLTYFKRYIGI